MDTFGCFVAPTRTLFFFAHEKKKNTVQSMSNVGEDRIRINADAIQALNTFVGTTKSLTTHATTVVEGVNEVRLEALSATSATVVNSNAISTESARAAQKENALSAAIGQETVRATSKEAALVTDIGQLKQM